MRTNKKHIKNLAQKVTRLYRILHSYNRTVGAYCMLKRKFKSMQKVHGHHLDLKEHKNTSSVFITILFILILSFGLLFVGKFILFLLGIQQ